jgi:hypothetical protein
MRRMGKIKKAFIILFLLAVFAGAGILSASSHSLTGSKDPCDNYGDCVSSTIRYIRSNPDGTLYVGDSFAVDISIITGPNTTGYSVSWFYPSVFQRSGNSFTVAENRTGVFTVGADVTFTGTTIVNNKTQTFTATLSTSQTVTVIPLIISFRTQLVNVTDSYGFAERNPDGSFYRNDTFCDSWAASFQFSSQRTDIKINVTSITPPSLKVLNYSYNPIARTGRFCYTVKTDAQYRPDNVTLVARAVNWEGMSIALKSDTQPFAVVQYKPKFTTYAYMEYGNTTVPSSLKRPWILFVRYDGNLPGYSYQGDKNTLPFNGSLTLKQRAFFDSFTFTSLSYRLFSVNQSSIFMFNAINSTGSLKYAWLNSNSNSPLTSERKIEKYVFAAAPDSLIPLIQREYNYHNITMTGCWKHESGCYLKQNYWLVPFLWSGKLNITSVDSSGRIVPGTHISIAIHNPSPLNGWLIGNFKHVFGNDKQALKEFAKDLYPTNATMSFSGAGSLSIVFNQTSLIPPQITITAGNASFTGSFTFVPVFVNSTLVSVIDAFGNYVKANATVPLWAYNAAQGNAAFMTENLTKSFLPLAFRVLVLNSTAWIIGSTTYPQTPSEFASQRLGFWPLGVNLTVYANFQGGGIKLLGTQKTGPNEYKAVFYIAPWSGGVSSAELIQGGKACFNQSLPPYPYPSPFPPSATGFYSVLYPASGQDTQVVFTNIWGAKTAIDIGAAPPPTQPSSLVPFTTAAVFGIAFIIWFIIRNILKSRRSVPHD